MKLFGKPISLFKTKLALPLFRLGHKFLSGKGLERAGFAPAAYFDELQRHGFKIYIIDEQRQQLEIAPDFAYLTRKLKARGTNLLCVKGNPIATRLPDIGITGAQGDSP